MADLPVATPVERDFTLRKKDQRDAAEGPSGSSSSKNQTELPCFCGLRVEKSCEHRCNCVGGNCKPTMKIQCHRCKRFCHDKCINMTPKESERIEGYYCPPCREADPTLQIKRMEPKLAMNKRQKSSPSAQFVPKKRTRSTVKLEKLMRETTEQIETVTLDSDSDAESCDSNPTSDAQSDDTATSAAQSRGVPVQPSESLSAGTMAIVGRFIEEQRSADALAAAVDKEQQPCSSSSLGLGIGAAAGGRPLTKKTASTRKSKKNTVSESRKKKASSLPAEVLLNVVHCLDFNTLVALCFTNRTFHVVVQKNAGALAKRRDMRLFIQDSLVILHDCNRQREIICNPDIPSTYEVAMRRRVFSDVGFHMLKTVHISNDWRRMSMDRLFSALPALRSVETLRLSIAAPNSLSAKSVDDVNRFAAQFPRLQRLGLHALGTAHFDWRSFMLSEGALKLPQLDARAICGFQSEDGSSSYPTELDFLRYCFDCTQLPEGVGKLVRYGVHVSRSVLVTSLRGVANADRTITVQFSMSEDPNLSTDKFYVQRMEQPYGRKATHYKSRTTNVSAYQRDTFFAVTNDPTFDPFVEDY